MSKSEKMTPEQLAGWREYQKERRSRQVLNVCRNWSWRREARQPVPYQVVPKGLPPRRPIG